MRGPVAGPENGGAAAHAGERIGQCDARFVEVEPNAQVVARSIAATAAAPANWRGPEGVVHTNIQIVAVAGGRCYVVEILNRAGQVWQRNIVQ